MDNKFDNGAVELASCEVTYTPAVTLAIFSPTDV